MWNCYLLFHSDGMADELKLEDFLPQEAVDVLDSHDISHPVYEQDGQYYTELEWYSLHDGDQIFTVWFKFNPEDGEDAKQNALYHFQKKLNDIYEDFDVDEYVEMWLEAKKTRQCHLSARQLVEDGEDVDQTLKTISDEICEIYHKIYNR